MCEARNWGKVTVVINCSVDALPQASSSISVLLYLHCSPFIAYSLPHAHIEQALTKSPRDLFLK